MRSKIQIFILIIPTIIFGQVSEWSKIPSIGYYFTPLKMERYTFSSGISPNEKIYENYSNLTVTFPINQKLRLGFQYISVATKVTREPVDRSSLFGILGQYNFRAQKKMGIYVEGGYAFGNYCPCGNAEPYTSDTLNNFRSLGLGIDYRFANKLHLKLGLITYNPLKKHNDVYNWTQPFIGLNYYFGNKYRTPLKSRFIKKDDPLPKNQLSLYWKDLKKRTWNIGLTSSGFSITQQRPFPGQQDPLFRYLEFTVVPRLNYWINQAVMVGIQGTYYYYENNYSSILPKTDGFGIGAQARFYPLNLKHRDEFRAIRIGKRAKWNVSPIVGIELHTANYSWLEPQEAGKSWQYVDFQPLVGISLANKRWFNLFVTIGPTIGFGNNKKTSPTNGVVISGLEFNFTRDK
jgi:hypothetical protein